MLDHTLSSEYSLAEYIHHFKLKIEHKFAELNGEILPTVLRTGLLNHEQIL